MCQILKYTIYISNSCSFWSLLLPGDCFIPMLCIVSFIFLYFNKIPQWGSPPLYSFQKKENIGTSEALSIWHHPPIRDPVITVLCIVDFYEIHVFCAMPLQIVLGMVSSMFLSLHWCFIFVFWYSFILHDKQLVNCTSSIGIRVQLNFPKICTLYGF